MKEDPSVTIPAAVRRQAEADEAAEQAEAAAREAAMQGNLDPPPEEPPAVPQDPPTPPPTPPVPPPAPTDNPPTIEGLQRQVSLWEQRYRSLQGMFEKAKQEQIPGSSEVAELKKQVAQLTELLKHPPAAQVPAHLAHLTEAEREAMSLDGELPREVRMAQGIVEDLLAKERKRREEVERRVEELHTRVVQQGQDKTENTQWDKVRKLVPKADEINEDPLWIKWLSEPDERTGKPRQERAEALLSIGDAKGVAEYFIQFQREILGESPAVVGQVKPDSTGSVPQRRQPRVLRVRESDIQRIYQDMVRKTISDESVATLVRLGLDKNNIPPEGISGDVIDALIDNAIASGRVVPG
jgi:hypothetical protein